jgi:hypothetical protein
MKRIVVLTLALVAVARFAAAATPSACQLLSAADVAAVQGQPFADAKLTEATAGGLALSQCFYELADFTKSVSVELIRDDATAEGNGAVEFWRDLEEKNGEEAGERESEGEKEEEGAGLPVHGLGHEALWSGTKISGALYVRAGDAVLRISVGGPGSEADKRAKAKQLAERALHRM